MLKQLTLQSALLLISCLIVAVLVYYAGNKFGPGLTYDSVNYLYAGISLSEKGKLLRPFQSPYIEWPPLYPCFIALLHYLPGNLLQNVFYFQVLVASLTVGLGCILARQVIRQKFVRLAAHLSLAFSTPVVLVNHFVWSESLFCLMVVLHILLLIHYVKQPAYYSWSFLVIIGVLSCMQRQVGAFFVAGGAYVLLLYPTTFSFRKRAVRSVFYVLLSAVCPLLLWWIRNYQLRGLLMNDYRDTLFLTPFFTHWSVYNDIFTSWWLPDEIHLWVRISIVYGGLLVFLMAIFRKFRKNTYVLPQPATLILTCLFCSYFILLFMVSFSVAEEIDDRKLAPVYIPGMLLFFSIWDKFIESSRRKRWLAYALLLWTVYPIARTVHNVYVWHHRPGQLPETQPVEEQFREKLKYTIHPQ